MKRQDKLTGDERRLGPLTTALRAYRDRGGRTFMPSLWLLLVGGCAVFWLAVVLLIDAVAGWLGGLLWPAI